ncbi:MAG: YraN family protein [Gammaproteobacteria bacterium]
MSFSVKGKFTSRLIGQQVEDFAAQYLSQQGIQILEKNFQCKAGEIDIVGRMANILVFVEVRYRRSREFGHPLETVTRAKQIKLIRTAQYYLQRFRNHPPDCRFDVISAIGSISQLDWEWIPNAFQVQ